MLVHAAPPEAVPWSDPTGAARAGLSDVSPAYPPVSHVHGGVVLGRRFGSVGTAPKRRVDRIVGKFYLRRLRHSEGDTPGVCKEVLSKW